MQRRRVKRGWVAAVALMMAGPSTAGQKDLATTVQGTYVDDRNATLTVTRVGPDRVRVHSSDGRVLAAEVPLKETAGKVVQASGETTFALDRAQHPPRLQVSVPGGATWSGRKLDLADAAAGTYFGNVISDPKGAGKNDVTLTVARVGENRVRISSDYPRLPTVEVPLMLAMGKIISRKGDTAFVLDRAAKPARLDVSFHDKVSWSGSRRQ